MTDNPPGKAAACPQHYQPQLLVRLPRQDNRQLLGIDGNDLPFQGADVWNAWEISCLNNRGKPLAFVGRFVFPAESECLVESKSLKLYLNSLNQETMDSPEDLVAILGRDLSAAAGGNVEVSLLRPDDVGMPDVPAGKCLDDLDIAADVYEVKRELLRSENDALFEEITEEVLYTHLFRSNCPITNQPDWATLTVCYRGRKMPGELLLKYLVSYRRHNDYHENCVERIFCDLMTVFSPQSLTVEANFLRRGGLDINPVRTTDTGLNYLAFPRYSRQ